MSLRNYLKESIKSNQTGLKNHLVDSFKFISELKEEIHPENKIIQFIVTNIRMIGFCYILLAILAIIVRVYLNSQKTMELLH